jgi:hypothetical protein
MVVWFAVPSVSAAVRMNASLIKTPLTVNSLCNLSVFSSFIFLNIRSFLLSLSKVQNMKENRENSKAERKIVFISSFVRKVR